MPLFMLAILRSLFMSYFVTLIHTLLRIVREAINDIWRHWRYFF